VAAVAAAVIAAMMTMDLKLFAAWSLPPSPLVLPAPCLHARDVSKGLVVSANTIGAKQRVYPR